MINTGLYGRSEKLNLTDMPTTTKSAAKAADKPAKKSPGKKTAAPAKAKKAADNYTDPELRERLKNEIMTGDKGGKPGQWSARKAQLLTHEYEKEGGTYKHEERTESQEHLENGLIRTGARPTGNPLSGATKRLGIYPLKPGKN